MLNRGVQIAQVILWVFIAGCGGKKDDVVVEDVQQEVVSPDTGPVVIEDEYTPPGKLGDCALSVQQPANNIHIGGTTSELVIRGIAVYKKPLPDGSLLEIPMQKVGGFLQEDKPLNPDDPGSESLDKLDAEDWEEGVFEWKIDISGKPTGKYTVTLQAETQEGPNGEDPATCGAVVPVFIDNTCPTLGVLAPYDAEHPSPTGSTGVQYVYHRSITWRIAVQDQTAIESVEIFDSSGELVKKIDSTKGHLYGLKARPFPEVGSEAQIIWADTDVCKYGTGTETFSVVVKDTLGNVCDPENSVYDAKRSPYIVRCPAYATSKEIKLNPDYSYRRMASHDLALARHAADGREDIIIADSMGLTVLVNDGTGKFLSQYPSGTKLPGIEEPVDYFHMGDFDSNGFTDFIIISEQDLYVFLEAEVCVPDLDFDPSKLEEEDLPEFHPTKCDRRFALVETIELPKNAKVTATFMANIAKDTEADNEGVEIDKANLKDFIFATDKGATSLGLLFRHEGQNTWEGDALDADGNPVLDEQGNPKKEIKTGSWCRYWQPRFGLDKEPIPPLPHEETRCFKPTKYIAAAGNIVDINVGDYFSSDGKNLPDIIAIWDNYVSVFKNDGDGVFDIAFTQDIPSPSFGGKAPKLTRVLPGSFDTVDSEPLTDALLLLGDQKQVWTIFGDGNGKWRQVVNPQSKLMEVERRATCIEGELSDIVLQYIDDVDDDLKTFDVVALNRDQGTLWTMFSPGPSTSGTAFYDPHIVDLLPNPDQVLLVKLDDNVYWDAVVLSKEQKRVAVVYAGDPTLASDDPGYSAKGHFLGGTNVPTLLPTQNPGATNRCDSSLQDASKLDADPYKEWRAFEGTPRARMAPEFMAVGDFVGPDGTPDLVLMTEQTGVWKGDPDKLGDPRRVIYTYGSNGKSPTQLVDRSYYIPTTSFCKDLLVSAPDDPDEAQKFDPEDPANFQCQGSGDGGKMGPAKGDVTGLAAGTVDEGSRVDLLVTSDTNWTPVPPGAKPEDIPNFPELTTTDILLGKSDGRYEQMQQDGTQNELLAADSPPGEWFDLGVSTCARPRAMAATYCDSKENDAWMDMVVLCDIEVVAGKPPVTHLMVYQSQGNGKAFNEFEVAPVPYGKMIKMAYLGEEGAAVDQFIDILVAEKSNVKAFRGLPFCAFSNEPTTVTMGPEITGMAVGDLNQDGLADLVTPLYGGTVAVAYGIYGVEGNNFDAPDLSLSYSAAESLGQAELADINADGHLDILVLDEGGAGLVAFMNQGNGKMLNYGHYLRTGPKPKQFQMADFNGDNCLDIVTMSPISKAASIATSKLSQFMECNEL